MAGTDQGDKMLFWGIPKGCWWCQPFIPEPGFGPAPCHDEVRAHTGCKCHPMLMDSTGATHPCSSAPIPPGVQTVMPNTGCCFWAGNYSAFPLSPFHMLDKVLAATRSQLACVPKWLQTNVPRHYGAPSHDSEPALTQGDIF